MSTVVSSNAVPVEAPEPESTGRSGKGAGALRWFVAILAAAAVLRAGLLMLEWPASNSDEATMGLMAMHIAEGRHFPGFMYGQSYMGTAESYLAAVVFWFAGPSTTALRVPMVLLFLAFLAVLFVLARRLYGTTVALVSAGLLALGSRELYGHELVAQGAIPETLLAGTVLLLLGHRILETAGVREHDTRHRWMLAGWGLTAMAGLWSTVLVAPFVATSALLVWPAVRRRSVAARGGLLAVGGGVLAGAVPWLLHDLTRPFAQSGLVAVVTMYGHGGTGLNGVPSPGLLAQVTNTVTTSLAYITGGAAIAHPGSPAAWAFGYADSWQPPTDDVVTTVWGLALVVLWSAAVVTCLRRLRRPSGGTGGAVTGAAERARAYTRLAMLAGAGLTVAAFAASPTPGVAPANNARYIVGVLIATPAILAPLWHLGRSSAARFLRPVVLAVVAASRVLGTVQAYRDAIRGTGESTGREVVEALRRAGVEHVYSGYLDCNRLIFLSREEVTCAVLFGDLTQGLQPGLDRYLPYRAAVDADPDAAYLFRTGDPRLAVLARATCRWQSRWQVAGYEVWQPDGRCAEVADGDPAHP